MTTSHHVHARLSPLVIEEGGRLALIGSPFFERNLTARVLQAALAFDTQEMQAFLTIVGCMFALHRPRRTPKKQVEADRRIAERFVREGEPDAWGLTYKDYLSLLGSTPARVEASLAQWMCRHERRERQQQIRRKALRQEFGWSSPMDRQDELPRREECSV